MNERKSKRGEGGMKQVFHSGDAAWHVLILTVTAELSM